MLLWWKFTIMMKIHYYDENLPFWWYYHIEGKNHIDESHLCDKNYWLWWKFYVVRISTILGKFIIVKTIEYNECRLLMKSLHFDENLSLLWKFVIMMKTHHHYEDLSLWWKLSIMMKIHHFDKIIILRKRIRLMEVSVVIKIHHCDKMSSLW